MWNKAEYAVAGRGHVLSGTPCQDMTMTYKGRAATVAALADGAGSAAMSHYGARAAVQFVSRQLGEYFDEYYNETSITAVKDRLMCGLWDTLDRVREEIGCGLKDLASTLLAVAVSGNRYIAFHIGDGVIGYMRDGRMLIASGPDNGEFANETVFTTSASAYRRLRVYKGRAKEIEGFVLMSDGTEHSLYNKRTETLSDGVGRIIERTAICSERTMSRMLRDSMQTITERTLDDCSIAVLSRAEAFPSIFTMNSKEQSRRLKAERRKRGPKKYVKRAMELLQMSMEGVSPNRQTSRSMYTRPKSIRRTLVDLNKKGLVDYEDGKYWYVF